MAVSRNELPQGLLSDVLNYLDITWSDEAAEKKISGFIAAGMIYLNKKLNETADYTQDGMPRTVLFEYVRYARDAALDVFENNYMSLILAMQHERAVERYAEDAVQAGGANITDL